MVPRHFTLPADLSQEVGTIEFDGIYDHSEVWVNGHFVGGRPSGYASVAYPLTTYVRFGGADNVVAVRVDHSRFADSRWYTGSGIYRHVRLQFTNPLHVAHWGTVVRIAGGHGATSTINVETTIENTSSDSTSFTLESEILLRGQVVARSAPGNDERARAGDAHAAPRGRAAGALVHDIADALRRAAADPVQCGRRRMPSTRRSASGRPVRSRPRSS